MACGAAGGAGDDTTGGVGGITTGGIGDDTTGGVGGVTAAGGGGGVPAFSLPAATWSTLSTDARPCTLTVPSGVRIFIQPPPVFSSTTPTAPS